MALDPQSKDSLMKFTMAAKKVIYNPERMKAFMQMLGSPDGAITAVQSVLAVIEKEAPDTAQRGTAAGGKLLSGDGGRGPGRYQSETGPRRDEAGYRRNHDQGAIG